MICLVQRIILYALTVKCLFDAENYQPGKAMPVHAIKAYGEEKIQIHFLLTSALKEGERCWQ
jgi:hypothetical protein